MKNNCLKNAEKELYYKYLLGVDLESIDPD